MSCLSLSLPVRGKQRDLPLCHDAGQQHIGLNYATAPSVHHPGSSPGPFRHGGAQPSARPCNMPQRHRPAPATIRHENGEPRPTTLPVASCHRPCCCAALSVCMLCSLSPSIRRPSVGGLGPAGLGRSGGRWEGGRGDGVQARHGLVRRGEGTVGRSRSRPGRAEGMQVRARQVVVMMRRAVKRRAVGGVSDIRRRRRLRRRRCHGHGIDGTPALQPSTGIHNLHGTARREAATSIPNIPTDSRAFPPSLPVQFQFQRSNQSQPHPVPSPISRPVVWTRAGQAGCLSRLPACLATNQKKKRALPWHVRRQKKRTTKERVSRVQSSPSSNSVWSGLDGWMAGRRPGGWVTRDYKRPGTQQLG